MMMRARITFVLLNTSRARRAVSRHLQAGIWRSARRAGRRNAPIRDPFCPAPALKRAMKTSKFRRRSGAEAAAHGHGDPPVGQVVVVRPRSRGAGRAPRTRTDPRPHRLGHAFRQDPRRAFRAQPRRRPHRAPYPPPRGSHGRRDRTGPSSSRSASTRTSRCSNTTSPWTCSRSTTWANCNPPYAGLTCFGAYVLNEQTNEIETMLARFTIVATGGCGNIYPRPQTPWSPRATASPCATAPRR